MSGTEYIIPFLTPFSAPRSRLWIKHLQAPQAESELAALRRSVARDCPFGSEDWITQTAKRLEVEITLRPRGRPRISENNGS